MSSEKGQETKVVGRLELKEKTKVKKSIKRKV